MSATGPLASVRVIELGGIGPVPLGSRLLADLGADVLRIVRPGDVAEGADRLGRGRPAMELDLKCAEGVAALLELIEASDVLLDSYRPGVTERLGLGPVELRIRHPGLIYARVSGWGQDGPDRLAAGHDINYLAISGVLSTIGPATGPPAPPMNLIADYAGGSLFMAVGVLAALLERERSGLGQDVDVAMVDGAAYLLTYVHDLIREGTWVERRESNGLDGGRPWYTTYVCADGEHVAVGAIEPKFFRTLLETLGVDHPYAQRDPQGWEELRAALTTAFAQRTRDEWAVVFNGVDACVSPVLWPSEAQLTPQAVARARFIDGEPAPAPLFSRTPATRRPQSHQLLPADWKDRSRLPVPPFDLELGALLDALGPRASSSLTADQIQRLRLTTDAILTPSLEQVRDIGGFDVFQIPAEGARPALLVCRPIDVADEVSVIYFVHGGGMVAGSCRFGLPVPLAWAAELGLAVVSVEYRLAPEHPHPAALDDVTAGLGWILEAGKVHGLDDRRIVMAGASAGGGLVATWQLAERACFGSGVIGQMLLGPMLDNRGTTTSARQMVGRGVWDRNANETGWTALLGPTHLDCPPFGSVPAREPDLRGLPPTFLDVGSAETFRDETVAFATKMWASGGEAELHVWPGGFHGFDVLAPGSALAQRAHAARVGWLRRLLVHSRLRVPDDKAEPSPPRYR